MFRTGPCHHLCESTLHSQLEGIKDLSKGGVGCVRCGSGAGAWVCLDGRCLSVVCQWHALPHYRTHPQHYLQISLQSLVVWCYKCDRELSLASIPDPSQSSLPLGVVGLQNVGNTCYINAALQALISTPALVQYFLSRPVPPMHSRVGPPVTSPTMTAAVHRFFWDVWTSPPGSHALQPNQILFAIRNSHPMFRGFQQHDTQEFLRCLMDQLHEEMKVPRLTPPCLPSSLQLDNIQVLCEGSPGSGSQSEAEEYETCDSGVSERSSLSEETSSSKHRNSRSSSPEGVRLKTNHLGSPRMSKKHTSYRSIVSDVFDGKLLSSVQCLTCNRISTRVETFQDLSLPIPSRDHVQMLHQGTVNAAKCTNLYQVDQGWLWWLWDWVCSLFWGPTVSLHDCLAAFFSADELKGDNMYSCDKCNKLRNGIKYSRVVECPEVLCIHLKRIRHELMFSSKISNHVTFPLHGLDMAPFLHNNSPVLYELTSVICHYGPAAGGGHYTCFSLNPLDSKWYEYDDQSVRRVSPDVIKNCPAYVLFYRKDNSEVEAIRQQCSLLEEANPKAARYLVPKDWLSRLRTMADPGPVDNQSLLCSHGGLSLEEYSTVSASVWEYIVSVLGGGPPVPADEYSPCQQCSQPELNLLSIQLHDFNRLRGGGESELYAVSARWLSDWEDYVQGNTNQPPGPINNSNIVSTDSNPPGEEYDEITKGQWDMLVALYGGGPVIQIREPSTDSDTRSLDERLSNGDNVDSGCWFSAPFPNQQEEGGGGVSSKVVSEVSEDRDSFPCPMDDELIEVTSSDPTNPPLPTDNLLPVSNQLC